jgi:RHS repeat-associated protein
MLLIAKLSRLLASAAARCSSRIPPIFPVTYGFDGLHRTISRTDAFAPGEVLTLTYGPDGQVATATRGGVDFTYLHDEGGQRLMKSRTGAPVAAYLDEGYLDERGLTERISVGGRTVGVLKNGVFETVATDLRGSVLAEASGVPRLASPFGQRDVHTAQVAAIEYVEKGYDADLGLVRMGARDYDPETGRFTTPDPLFLETVEKCLEKPKQANLFGYAQGDPLGFGDPSGLEGFDLSEGLSAAGRFIAGVGGGITEAMTGSPGPMNDPSSRDYQLGRAAGLFLTGTAQLAVGLSLVTEGFSVGARGALLTATVEGALAGVPAMALGAAAVYVGAKVAVAGAANVQNGMDVFMSGKPPSSAGKLQKEVERGQAPNGVDRADKGRGPFEKDHVHFGEGERSAALNNDGTWKHNPQSLTQAIKDWLTGHGWKLP